MRKLYHLSWSIRPNELLEPSPKFTDIGWTWATSLEKALVILLRRRKTLSTKSNLAYACLARQALNEYRVKVIEIQTQRTPKSNASNTSTSSMDSHAQ